MLIGALCGTHGENPWKYTLKRPRSAPRMVNTFICLYQNTKLHFVVLTQLFFLMKIGFSGLIKF